MRIFSCYISKRIFMLLAILIFTMAITSTVDSQPRLKRSTIIRSIQSDIKEAQQNEVDIFAPKTFEKVVILFEKYRQRTSRTTISISRTRQVVEIETLLEKAIQTSNKVKKSLKKLIKTRLEIKEYGFEKVAAEEISKAETQFHLAIIQLETDIKSKQKNSKKALALYRLACITWLDKVIMKEADLEIAKLKDTLSQNLYRLKYDSLTVIRNKIISRKNSKFKIIEFIRFVKIDLERIFDNYYIPFFINIPDTLLIYDFELILESVTNSGFISDSGQLTVYNNVSGTAWTKFNCPKSYFDFYPIDFSDFIMIDTFLKVVDTVSQPTKEISINDAKLINPRVSINERLPVSLYVNYIDSLEITLAIKEYIQRYLMLKKGYILVGFDNISIHSIPNRTEVGRVFFGNAYYPTTPRIPKVLKLNLSGFTAIIDTLTITPTNAIAEIELQFPKSLASGRACQPASVKLGETIITQDCQFYAERLNDAYDPFWIGNTDIVVTGTGFVADFSDIISYSSAVPALVSDWKGVYLSQGKTISSNSGPIVSNSGYLKADYSFSNATITSKGFTGNLNLISPFKFKTINPYGYELSFTSGNLKLIENNVIDGSINDCTIIPPQIAAITSSGDPIKLHSDNLSVSPNRDLMGIIVQGKDINWGELTDQTSNLVAYSIDEFHSGVFYLSSQYLKKYWPLSSDNFTNFQDIIINGVQGATLKQFKDLTIFTPDTPNEAPISFGCYRKENSWLNIVNDGVNGLILFGDSTVKVDLGPTHRNSYVSTVPFNTTFEASKKPGEMNFIFVNSSVYNSKLNGSVKLNGPSNTELNFTDMQFTSTAQNAGALVDLSTPTELEYWGLELVGEPGYSSAGLVCVKTGQIILTAAGLSEPRHFTNPFYLKWGEMLASGDKGRLFFDYNTAGQEFDGFNMAPSAILLSKYVPNTDGYLQVGGNLYFDFFGASYANIKDYKYNDPNNPYNNRNIELSNDSPPGFYTSNTKLLKNWFDNSNTLDFDIKYDEADQDGFIGNGSVDISFIANKMGASLILNRDRICFSVHEQNRRDFELGPVANFSSMHKIWGCGCIENGQLKRLVLGAELETSGNANILLRSAAYGMVQLVITPSTTELTVEGVAYLAVFPTSDVEVNGRIYLKTDYANGYVEGNIIGSFKATTLGNGISASGQTNWHLGLDYNLIQGKVAVNILTLGSSTGAETGFFCGINVPKDKAWILSSEDPRFRIKPSLLPNELTGVYAFVHFHDGVNLYLVSGGYDVYAGLGLFLLTNSEANALGAMITGIPGSPYVLGHVGVSIYGDILGGLVSASAWGNLTFGFPPPGFDGKVGLKGCVLWVACYSVGLNVGLNTTDGFYIE